MIALVEGTRGAEDTQRDRPVDPAHQPDDRLPLAVGDPAPDGGVRRARSSPGGPRGPAGLPDPDDHRGPARRPSASRAWIGWCGATCWPCRVARWRQPATSSTLLLDKTGTITYGNRQASRLVAVPGVEPAGAAGHRPVSSLADQTPEGRSIVELALAQGADDRDLPAGADFVEFTAQTRMSRRRPGRRHADPQGRGVGRGRLGRRRAATRGSSRSSRRSPRRAARRWWSPEPSAGRRGCSA